MKAWYYKLKTLKELIEIYWKGKDWLPHLTLSVRNIVPILWTVVELRSHSIEHVLIYKDEAWIFEPLVSAVIDYYIWPDKPPPFLKQTKHFKSLT